MPNNEHLGILSQGVCAWNKWRDNNPEVIPDLSYAYLTGTDLSWANLRYADLRGARLESADLTKADLSKAILTKTILIRTILSLAKLNGANLVGADLAEAILRGADLTGADLDGADLQWAKLDNVNLLDSHLCDAKLDGTDFSEANLNGADLRGAKLRWADLYRSDFSNAKLIGTDLSNSRLVETILDGADLTGCNIYGISAWNLKLRGANQKDLVITPHDEAIITVDNLEVAQFIYLLLRNDKIRDVIDTIAKKAVLILGRFTPERKAVLDALRIELRNRDYLPIIFDFDKPSTKDFTDTIRILAGMSLFVIADISNPKSSPLELQATVPNCMIPFVPIIQEGEESFAMFKDLQNKYDKWVLPVRKYYSCDSLIRHLDKDIIEPALQVHSKLMEEQPKEVILLR